MAVPPAAASAIVRSWKSTFNSLAIALVSAAISALLFMYFAGGIITAAIACVPAVIALVMVFMAISGAGQCACPSCAKPLDGLSTGSNEGVLCRDCLHYLEGKNGQLWVTDEMRVADSCLFGSRLPEKFTFPDVCCVCAAPATQRIDVSMTTTNASSVVTQSTIGVTSSTRTTVRVPHCDAHKDGALLTGTKDSPSIKFRSYPYLRAFCEANGTKPN